MNALVDEWIAKAEGDWHTLQREVRARKHPNHDAACFHAQQCAEKYLKAFLQLSNQPFPKTHNLTDLLELVLVHDWQFETLRDILEALNHYAVIFRYPGEEATRTEALAAAKLATAIRKFARTKLGLSEKP